jgi:hypothetical protein
MPGYRNVGDDVDFASCSDAVRTVEMDGAVPVTKRRVYSTEPPPGQHYIAMVLWPGEALLTVRLNACVRFSSCEGAPRDLQCLHASAECTAGTAGLIADL